MITKTESLEAYKNAIKAHYEIEKSGKYSSFLIHLSRARLRQLCEERLKESNNIEDKLSFSLVFGFEYDVNNRNKLKLQTDKFRPIETFFKGETDLADIEAINIAALLVNFNPRPFRYFISKPLPNEALINEEKHKIGVKHSYKNRNKLKHTIVKKIGIGLLGVIGITSIGYTTKNIILPEPQCMQWQNNHYEVVDCNSNEDNLIKQHNIIPFNEEQSKLIKVEVSDTTQFFKNGKPLYWYAKVNGKPEFFNTHGVHPETGKALKQVSEYIVNKYVKNNNYLKKF
ncbi:hypothetical protein [Flavobacterium sp.]|uniref:hypothetical protein n=1 Tax=Flavobacterium sp. TaxID=239 RepID=UPI00352907F1